MGSIDWNGRITSYLQKTGVVPAGAAEIIASLGSACQAAVERQIGRTLSTQSYTELYSGTGKNVLFLRHDPIVSVQSVKMAGTDLTIVDPNALTYPPNQVAINGTGDGLILTNGDVWNDSSPMAVLVTYRAGLADVFSDQPPDDLAFAVTYWASRFFRGRDRVGESSQTIGQQTTTFSQDIPPDVKRIIDNYKRPFVPC